MRDLRNFGSSTSNIVDSSMNRSTYTHHGWVIRITKEENAPGDVVLAKQTHGATILAVEKINHKKTFADGIIVSRTSGKAAGASTADCMPLVLLSKGCALILHVSRKSLVAGLLDRVPNHINPRNISHVWIGPHICERHFTFEKRGEEITQFCEKFPHVASQTDNVTHISLRKAVQTYFDTWNISKDTISEDNRCTYENGGLPSHRRLKETTQDSEQRHLIIYVSS